MSTNKHYDFIDILRFIAIAAVLLQHTASEYIDGGYGVATNTVNVFRGITRWNILIFVMISGLLLIPKNIAIGKMWKKYIKRITIVFCVWSALYTVYNVIYNWNSNSVIETIKTGIGSFIGGGTQRLWYLVMLIGLYAVIPLVSKMLNNMSFSEKKYLLIILLIVTSVFPTLTLFEPISVMLGLDFDRISSVFPGIYIFYLVLGACYFELKEKITKKAILALIYSLGLICTVISAVIHYSIEGTLNVDLVIYVIICFSIFLFADSISEKLPRILRTIIRSVADCSFGIYLVHTFVQYFFKDTGIAKIFFGLPTIVSIIVYFIALFLISWGLTRLIRCISIGRKIT